MKILARNIELGQSVKSAIYMASMLALVLGGTVFIGTKPASAGPYPYTGSITNSESGKCLTVAATYPVAGTKLTQYPCSDSDANQHWTFDYSYTGYIIFHANYNHSLCIEAGQFNNSPVVVNTCNINTLAQKWTQIVGNDNPFVLLQSWSSHLDGFCVTSYNDDTGGTIGQTIYCNPSNRKQEWRLWTL